MTIKLNLTVEESFARDVKLYARKHNTSVSKIVQQKVSPILYKNEKNKEESMIEKHQALLKKYEGKFKGKFDNLDNLRDEYLKEQYGL